jgi:hypothetical protein
MRAFRAASALTVFSISTLLPLRLAAQDAAPPDSVRSRLASLEARVDSLQRGWCPAVSVSPAGVVPADSVELRLQRLAERIETLRQQRCAAAPGRDSAGADDLAALRAAAAAAAGSDTLAPAAADTTFVGRQRNASALNPDISATGDIRFVAREGRQEDNAVAREFEIALQSALDPYSFTKIFLTFEDEEVGIEEGYIYWTGLPGNIRVDAGKFKQEIGDLNHWHLHALPETEYPLVYQRYAGEEGLAGIGVSLYSALPVSLAGGTHELWLQGTTSESEPLYASGRQPTVLARLKNFWQLDRATFVQLGATATGGNNDDAGLKSRLLGVDFRTTWRPPSAGTRKEVTLRAEGYRLHSDDNGTVTNRYGAFAGLTARLSRRIVLGTRYDWVEAARGPEDTEWRLTPSLTWWQSEFVYLRLEGEHRHSELDGHHNLLTLQAVWAMGPHKHETY